MNLELTKDKYDERTELILQSEIHRNPAFQPPHVFIVGNKVDEERLRKVPVDAHCAFAKRHDLKAFYVSAKTGDSVTMMFR
ncbi:unnamed protein product [Cylicostephanus goldi]|uniref:Uncharacterized protein n=1 Tax=Cylicostephanus goldi TaxID=71465 RepID=A0A3P6QKH2_CYLGO|nr:unnamed protein product [Cylicostephanus goldi]